VYDLIVVGGGPAGASAARRAAKIGLETLLIEKEQFPRYKACAGALSQRAMSYLDFDIPDHIIEREVFGARVHFNGRVIERRKDYRLSVLVTRSVLDSYLLEKTRETGVEVKTGERVVACTEDEDCVEIRTSENVYRGKFVVLAEGSQGRLKNGVRRKDRKTEYAVAVVTEIEEENEYIDSYIHNAIDLHFGVAKLGYGWIFPHEGYFSIGIAGLASCMPHPRKVLTDFLRDKDFSGDYRLHAHMLPAGGVRRKLVGSRVVLTGDAAGFVDAFYGEGLAYAIRSGQIAVDVISDIVLGEKSLSSVRRYESVCEAEFGANLRWSLMMSRIMHRFPGIFFRLLAENEEVLDRFLDVAGAKTTYRSYMTWLMPRVPGFVFRKPGRR
jgi:geranylgeranyl reductase family protein